MSATVAAVVPTHNHKSLLLTCVTALIGQTRTVDTIYIIDNGSTDGTREALVAQGFLTETTAAVVSSTNPSAPAGVSYIRMERNLGSMGGFAEGMRRACQAGHGWVWLVDDDSAPADTCLQKLLGRANDGDLLGPIALASPGTSELSFPLRDTSSGRALATLEEALASDRSGTLEQTICPFHGCLLISRAVQEAIGGILPETFHWGGEVEYAFRARDHGFRILTVVQAVNYHPVYRVRTSSTLLGSQIEVPPGRLQSYCFYRNNAFILWRYFGPSRLMRRFCEYAWFFLITSRFDLRNLALFAKATFAGIAGVWGGERKYLDQ
jgi:rhamnopyranosyl-N-acetylglucosaminyl-diphospho-decaprenol beta-1,3/1,4-galactofuranosyltransferase